MLRVGVDGESFRSVVSMRDLPSLLVAASSYRIINKSFVSLFQLASVFLFFFSSQCSAAFGASRMCQYWETRTTMANGNSLPLMHAHRAAFAGGPSGITAMTLPGVISSFVVFSICSFIFLVMVFFSLSPSPPAHLCKQKYPSLWQLCNMLSLLCIYLACK